MRILIFVSLCLPLVSALAQDNWPIPTVALYDCNVSAAIADNASQRSALNSASTTIMKDIINDTTTAQVFLLSYGFSDTTKADMASSGKSVSFPDTGRSPDAVYDFIIASKIVGNAGGYTLSISILDGRTFAHVLDGSSSIASATTSAIETACLSAVKQILPLAVKIRNYWKTIKATNPLYTINPVIDIVPASGNPPAGGKTDVALTATDCDGLPIVNRQLVLTATKGSFSATTVQTDNKGKTAAVFNAGTSTGVATLTAVLQNPLSVIHDSIPSTGATTVIIGDVAGKKLWALDFDMSRNYSGCNDKLIEERDGTRWKQTTKTWIQRARGRFIGTSNDDAYTELSFNDSTLSLSGLYFSHEFNKETYTDITGKLCPQTDWTMSGTSYSYDAQRNDDWNGEADLEFDHSGMHMFHISIPFALRDMYGYKWYTDGKWDKGQCVTTMEHSGNHFKLPLGTAGGVTYWGEPPVPGLSIVPWYTSGVISGYTVTVNDSYSGYASDASYYMVSSHCFATITPLFKVTAVKDHEPLNRFFLSQNYPNPFNPSTSISFSLASRAFVSLKVFDVIGREVAMLVSEVLPAGTHSRQWNAAAMSSGIYFYRLQTGAFVETKKLVLMR
jgi:hypothetical protein